MRTLPVALRDPRATLEAESARIETRSAEIVWIEELIDVAETPASTTAYALLKREDERHLTMQGYDNPVFVEDIVRNAAVRLREDARVTWFKVRAENHESIHDHNAFPQVTWARPREQTS